MAISAVLDTNIVLDLWLFSDPATELLRQDLQQETLCWIATQAMRDELERVLTYPHLIARMAFGAIRPAQVLAAFDARVQLQAAPAKVALTCKDPDDQKFIDLAVTRQALLLSKDKAVLCMAKRMRLHGVHTGSNWAALRPSVL